MLNKGNPGVSLRGRGRSEDISGLISRRVRCEMWVCRVATKTLCARYGKLIAHAYRDTPGGRLHIALVKGEWDKKEPVYVRIHAAAAEMNALKQGSERAEGWLERTLAQMHGVNSGVIIILNCHEVCNYIFGDALSVREEMAVEPGMSEWAEYEVSRYILRDCKVGQPDFMRDRLTLMKER